MRSWRHPLSVTLVLTITIVPTVFARSNRRGRNFSLKSQRFDAFDKDNGSKSSQKHLNSSLHESQDSPSTIASPPKKSLSTLLNEEIQSFHDDIAQIASLPPSSLTTPCSLISRDRTYTKTWTLADWDEHQEQSLTRYSHHVKKWPSSS